MQHLIQNSFSFYGGSNYKDENLNKYELSMHDPHPLIYVLVYYRYKVVFDHSKVIFFNQSEY